MEIEAPTSRLVQMAQEGDKEAFEQLIIRYRSRLKKQIKGRMGEAVKCRLEAEDILQETFAAAFKSLGKFRSRDEESYYRWLGSIAEHLIWNASQKKDWSRLTLENDVAEGGVSPSKSLRRNERFDRLERAISDLSTDHRNVIIMSRIKGLKLREIAVRMNRSTDAVKKLLARALLQLKNSFGDTESLHLPDRQLRVEGENHDG